MILFSRCPWHFHFCFTTYTTLGLLLTLFSRDCEVQRALTLGLGYFQQKSKKSTRNHLLEADLRLSAIEMDGKGHLTRATRIFSHNPKTKEIPHLKRVSESNATLIKSGICRRKLGQSWERQSPVVKRYSTKSFGRGK